jgi:hypothetical protein
MKKLKLQTLIRDEEVEMYWTLHQFLLFINTTLHVKRFWESLIHNALTILQSQDFQKYLFLYDMLIPKLTLYDFKICEIVEI